MAEMLFGSQARVAYAAQMQLNMNFNRHESLIGELSRGHAERGRPMRPLTTRRAMLPRPLERLYRGMNQA